jgi:ElaB/YqjD/DUF883 family membrane-anchored ribosome-binding protein
MQTDQQFSSTAYAEDGAAAGAQAKASEMAGQAQEKAQQAAGQVQDRMREQIDQRSSQTAAQIKEQASDLRSVSESLREQGKEGPAKAADRLAGYAERVGGYLHEKDSQALLADAESFGRSKPYAVIAGGVALGFAASRFLKASSTERYRSGATAPRSQQQPAAANGALGQPVASVPTGPLIAPRAV